jgi:hypothetical protein
MTPDLIFLPTEWSAYGVLVTADHICAAEFINHNGQSRHNRADGFTNTDGSPVLGGEGAGPRGFASSRSDSSSHSREF